MGRSYVFLQRIFPTERYLPAASAAALLPYQTKVPGGKDIYAALQRAFFVEFRVPRRKDMLFVSVCQVFISPGRPGKTHFRAAMRRSSDLGAPLRTVAAPRGAVPGCSTWVQGYLGAHLGAAPECRGTWVQYQGAVPGCSTWGGAPRKGWVAPAPREGCRTPPGVPPLVAHLCHTATIIIWKAHPVRGGAPREGWRTPWRVLASTGECQ